MSPILKMLASNRGGSRPGSGRKPIYAISEQEIKRLVRAARKKAKVTGKNIADVLINLAYQTEDKRTALGAIRVYLDNTVIKSPEKEVETSRSQCNGLLVLSSKARELFDSLSDEERNRLFPDARIILPELQPDPADQILFANTQETRGSREG